MLENGHYVEQKRGDIMSKNTNRLLYSNLVKLIIGLGLIIASITSILSYSIHIVLLVAGIFIIGMSVDGMLVWYGKGGNNP